MVDVPEPPDITNRGAPREFEWVEETSGEEGFRREELENWLRDGAWTEGFNEWTAYTDLDATQIRVIDDLGLFQALDFYWDPTDDRLRFDTPAVPDDWRERDTAGAFGSGAASAIDTALQDLGRTVQEMLETYLEDDLAEREFDSDDG